MWSASSAAQDSRYSLSHDFGMSLSICLGRMTCRYSKLLSESGQVSSSSVFDMSYLKTHSGRSKRSCIGISLTTARRRDGRLTAQIAPRAIPWPPAFSLFR